MTPTADDGFSLIEVIVSLSIIAVVMTSAAGFFLTSLKSTGGLSSRQAAVTLTNEEMESIRSVPPAALLSGRVYSGTANNAVSAAFTRYAKSAALTKFDDLTQAGLVDASATASSSPSVPTYTTQTVNNQVFTLYNFVDPCWVTVPIVQTANLSDVNCGAVSTAVAGSTTTKLYRISVATTWTGGPSTNCTGGCSYSASSLVDPNKDATFKSNVSQVSITGISPSSVAAGTSRVVTLSGTGFIYGASATACSGATSASVDQSTITSTSVSVTITAGSTPTSQCNLQITNPDGGYDSTFFTISYPPTVTSWAPTSIQNYVTKPVSITGSNFVNPTVTATSGGGIWGSVTATSTTINSSFTPALASIGSAPFTVTNQDGGIASNGSITVTRSTPVVTTSATSVPATTTGKALALAVTDLAPASLAGVTATASRGSVSVSGRTDSTLSLSYNAPSTTGSDVLTITNPDGGSTTYTITVTAAPPDISSVSTTTAGTTCISVLCKSWKTTFTVNGTNLTSGTVALLFGGSSVTPASVSVTSTKITFTYTKTYTSYTVSTAGTSYGITVTTSVGSDSATGYTS